MRAKNLALVAFLFHGISGVVSVLLGMWTGLESPVFLCFLLLGTGLIWVLVFVYLRQLSLVSVEEEDIKALSEKKASGARMFSDGAYESFSARARLRQMERWFLPGATLLIALYMLAVPILRFAGIVAVPRTVPAGPIPVAALGIAAIAFVLLVLGKYANGLASAREWKMAETGGALSVFCAICSLAVSCGVVAVHMGLPKVEAFFSFLIPVVAGVLGIELAANFVLHVYKPRVPSGEYHPPYDSRLLRMVARPAGAFRTVAEALDYQFGFKLSHTWFYRFVERAVAPLILFQIIAFYGLTCIVVVNPEEQAVIEKFGMPSESILQPGLHFKLPWPIEKAFKYGTKRISSMAIGVHGEHAEHAEPEDIVLWTKAHGHHHHHFIVASSEAVSAETGELESVPVNLLSAEVVVQYRINDLRTFLYRKVDPVEVLESVAAREIVRFVVSVDLFDIMGAGRLEASRHLASRISSACKDAELGLEIVYAGFENVHPPVEVAGAFQEVVGAIEEQHTKVLAAESYRNRVIPLAEYQRAVLKTRANAYKFRRETVASAAVEQFRKQNEADKRLTRVYRTRKFLDMMEEALKDTRKYVMPEKPNARQVIIVDVKEKLRPDFLDMDLGAAKE
jgi:regulator of protease activity HflC (stomatin/prohibitin superfamily)/uncharacterized membrane protein (Fun14 family)